MNKEEIDPHVYLTGKPTNVKNQKALIGLDSLMNNLEMRISKIVDVMEQLDAKTEEYDERIDNLELILCPEKLVEKKDEPIPKVQ